MPMKFLALALTLFATVDGLENTLRGSTELDSATKLAKGEAALRDFPIPRRELAGHITIGGMDDDHGGDDDDEMEDFGIGLMIDVDEEDLVRCYDNLFAADLNGDYELSIEEYANFVFLQSNGTIDYPFELLSPAYVMIFYADACAVCYEETEDCDCCVGDAGKILIDECELEQFRETVTFICVNVDHAISCDTKAPSVAPSGFPTPRPSVAPSDAPSFKPTGSNQPSNPPSFIPTGSNQPSNPPSIEPTGSNQPSNPPSIMPTGSNMPSNPPSGSPPTRFPTFGPTGSPSMSPSEPLQLLCVEFSFGLNNNAGLTPTDIIQENGNMLKTGVEIATATTVTDILNETFHDLTQFVEVESALEKDFAPIPMPVMDVSVPPVRPDGQRERRDLFKTGPEVALFRALDFLFGRQYAQILFDSYVYLLHVRLDMMGHYRNRKLAGHHDERRLVYYTERIPPQVTSVIDNPACPADGSTMCAILSVETCVVLEEGDNIAFIQKCLESGIRYGLLSGEFQQAIPPEFIP